MVERLGRNGLENGSISEGAHLRHRAFQGIKEEVVVERVRGQKRVTGLVKRHRSAQLSHSANSAAGGYDDCTLGLQFCRAVFQTFLSDALFNMMKIPPRNGSDILCGRPRDIPTPIFQHTTARSPAYYSRSDLGDGNAWPLTCHSIVSPGSLQLRHAVWLSQPAAQRRS